MGDGSEALEAVGSLERRSEAHTPELVYGAGGVALFAVQFVGPAREWQWLALAYAVVGYLALAGQFTNENAFWPSLVAIVALFAVQQSARHGELETTLTAWIHHELTPLGGA